MVLPPCTCPTGRVIIHYAKRATAPFHPTSGATWWLFSHMEASMAEDIDKDHNLNSWEKFQSAMQEEEKRSTKPCASCFHRPDCTDEWNCGILRQWRIKYMKDTST